MDDVDFLSLNTHVQDDDLGLYFDVPELSDLTIRVGQSGQLHVSKAILASRSKTFREMLQSKDIQSELVIPDAPFTLFRALVRFN
jgi:hypothetical protein